MSRLEENLEDNDKELIATLKDKLASPDFEAQKEAAEESGYYINQTFLNKNPQFRQFLLKLGHESPNYAVRMAILNRIYDFQKKAKPPRFSLEADKSPETEVEPEIVDYLLRALELETHPIVLNLIMRLFRQLKNYPAVIEIFNRYLRKLDLEQLMSCEVKNDYYWVGQAIRTLGSIGNSDSVTLLLNLLATCYEHNLPNLEGSTIWALGQLGDQRAAKPLLGMLIFSKNFRNDIFQALGELWDADAVSLADLDAAARPRYRLDDIYYRYPPSKSPTLDEMFQLLESGDAAAFDKVQKAIQQAEAEKAKLKDSCPVHKQRLEIGWCRIAYGYPRIIPEREKAQQEDFPLAMVYSHGGCIVEDAKRMLVFYCPECRKNEQEWNEREQQRREWRQTKIAELRADPVNALSQVREIIRTEQDGQFRHDIVMFLVSLTHKPEYNPENVELMLELLEDKNEKVRSEAAHQLTEYRKNPRSLARIIEYYLDGVSLEAQQDLTRSLARMQLPELVPVFVKVFEQTGNPAEFRLNALRELDMEKNSRMRAGNEALILQTAVLGMTDSDPAIRLKAAEIVSKAGDTRALPVLVDIVNSLHLKGGYSWEKLDAIDALGRLGDSGAIEPLKTAWERYSKNPDQDSHILGRIKKALKKLGVTVE